MAKRMRKRDLIIEFLQLITGIGGKKVRKAAPRFELGIKDLQSSALPLGHAAEWEIESPCADRISHATQAMLVVPNGHGEDLIALRVLEVLHKLMPRLSIEVLPLVGEGKAFEKAISEGWLHRVGPARRLPSGGFINQSISGFWADISAGLLKISWEQFQCVLLAARNGRVILAVGDLLPLLFAWISGSPFAFIGTPKSDYTWRSGPGFAWSDYYHSLKGTEWDPWEFALMKSSRCKAVAVRDHLTARGLRRHGVHACSPGNPMMDGFVRNPLPASLEAFRCLLLLCGSRMPEAGINFQRLLSAVDDLEGESSLALLVALGAEPSVEQLESGLKALGYCPSPASNDLLGSQACWVKGTNKIFLGPGQFFRWADWAEIGLANAGTATEQLVGLGIPVLSLPGDGPQFKWSFAFRQSRLLGGAVLPCKTGSVLARRLHLLLKDPELCQRVGCIGVKRMGPPGGSASLGALVFSSLFVE